MKNDFYEALGAAIRPHEKNKHMLIVIGDFNTKTGSVFWQYKDEQHGQLKIDQMIVTNMMAPSVRIHAEIK